MAPSHVACKQRPAWPASCMPPRLLKSMFRSDQLPRWAKAGQRLWTSWAGRQAAGRHRSGRQGGGAVCRQRCWRGRACSQTPHLPSGQHLGQAGTGAQPVCGEGVAETQLLAEPHEALAGAAIHEAGVRVVAGFAERGVAQARLVLLLAKPATGRGGSDASLVCPCRDHSAVVTALCACP